MGVKYMVVEERLVGKILEIVFLYMIVINAAVLLR